MLPSGLQKDPIGSLCCYPSLVGTIRYDDLRLYLEPEGSFGKRTIIEATKSALKDRSDKEALSTYIPAKVVQKFPTKLCEPKNIRI